MATGRKSIREEDDQRKEEEEEKSLITPREYLNEDVLFNILTRIPADILHKNFKYQCRQWRRLLSDEYFIKANICQSKQGIIYLEEVVRGSKLRYLLKYMELSGSEILRVSTLHDFKTELTIKSSCNGLLLIQVYHPSVYHIINPVTRKHTTFPTTKFAYWCELVFHGEYKVVELLLGHGSLCLCITTSNGKPPEHIQVPQVYHGSYIGSHVYINGIFYWTVGDTHIVSFDLDTKDFHILQTPDICRSYSVKLINLFGSLVVYCNRDVWRMEGGEWKKVFTLNDYAVFVGFLSDANLFIYRDIQYKLLHAYDVKKKEYRLVDDSKYPMNENHCFGYKVHVNNFLSLSYMV